MKVAAHYGFNGVAGCVSQHVPRSGMTLVGVYNCEQAGIDDGGSETNPLPWATVCERHHIIVTHRTLVSAKRHAVAPRQWCEQCREEYDRLVLGKGRGQ